MIFGRLSIRTKLTIVVTLLLAITSIAVYLYFPARLRVQALESVQQNTAALTEMTAYSLAKGVSARDVTAVAEVLTAMRRTPDLLYIVVFDEQGSIVASFNDIVANQVHFRSFPMRRVTAELRLPHGQVPAAPGATTPIAREIDGGIAPDGSVYQAVSPIRFRGRLVGSVYLGTTLEPINAAIARSKATVALVTVASFLIAVLATFALSTLITGPLDRIVSAAEKIADGDLTLRADVAGDDEVGQLATAFNLMVDRVHAAWRELEQWGKTLEVRVDERTRELKDEVEERRRAEEALRASEERYRLMIERNLAGVYIADAEGAILTSNDACARILGYPSLAELMAAGGAIPYTFRHDRDSIMRRLKEDGAVSNEEVELTRADGTTIWVLENVRLNAARDDKPATLEGIILDITDRKRTEEQIAFKAYHDALTRLPNRALFLDRARVALALAERNGNEAAVVFLDLDDMKAINDTLGHATGDVLLRMLGERLTTILRRGDTVARVGGDEFLLLLAQLHGERDAAHVARKVQEGLAEPFLVDDEEIHVTASIGVALYPSDGETAEALIRAADGAMYRIKESGGNGFEMSGRMARIGLGRLTLEKEIREAIQRDEFIVHYQPQVTIATRAVSGAEALVRWNHPERGVVEPSGFIAVAEQTGLIAAIGEAVLRKACAQMVMWQKGGIAPPRMAVNVSARQFYQRNFVGMIERALGDTGLDPRLLELEITETVAVQKTDRSLAMVNKLRDMGISIAIDDFGTGQSSLTYLKRFPVDAVKIDKSFVFDIERHASDEWIVTAVLMLAQQLGLRTVAEGVESERQLEFLAAHGCMEVQGYLISRPVPGPTFEKRFLVKPVVTAGASRAEDDLIA